METKAKYAGKDNSSVIKALTILDVLARSNFHGFSNSELAEATGFCRSDITRYAKTMINAGWVEEIQETGRLRLAMKRLPRYGLQAANDLQAAESKLDEMKQWLNVK